MQNLKQKIENNKIVRFLTRLLFLKMGKKSFSLYDVLKIYFKGIIEGSVSYRASAISFSFFLAIFPFLLVVLNLIPYVPLEGFQLDFWFFIDDILPFGTHDFFKDIFFDIAGKKRAGLLSSVFVLSIFLTTNGVNAIFGGFEYSYNIKETRSIIKLYIASIKAALILIFLLLISVILLLWVEVYVVENLAKLGILQENAQIIKLGKTSYFIFVALLFISVLFHFGSPEKGTSFFSPGAFLTIVLIGITTYLFGFYIENFAQYNQLYGSIGTLIIFLLYIWVNFIIVLLGFELNASLIRLKDEK